MNNTSLFAVVIILLAGILAVVNINSRTAKMEAATAFNSAFDSAQEEERVDGQISVRDTNNVQNN